MKHILIFQSLFISLQCFAGLSQNLTIEGKIFKIDGDNVILLKDGKEITVNRKDIPDYFKLRTGELVFAIVKKETIKSK